MNRAQRKAAERQAYLDRVESEIDADEIDPDDVAEEVAAIQRRFNIWRSEPEATRLRTVIHRLEPTTCRQ